MDLHVRVTINPKPAVLSPAEFDDAFNGEVMAFEKWFIARQREKGVINPAGLASAERGAVKFYLLYLADKEITNG